MLGKHNSFRSRDCDLDTSSLLNEIDKLQELLNHLNLENATADKILFFATVSDIIQTCVSDIVVTKNSRNTAIRRLVGYTNNTEDMVNEGVDDLLYGKLSSLSFYKSANQEAYIRMCIKGGVENDDSSAINNQSAAAVKHPLSAGERNYNMHLARKINIATNKIVKQVIHAYNDATSKSHEHTVHDW